MGAKPKVQEIVVESKPGILIVAFILLGFAFLFLVSVIDSYSYKYIDGFVVGILFTILFFTGISCIMKYHKSRKIYIKEVTNGVIQS